MTGTLISSSPSLPQRRRRAYRVLSARTYMGFFYSQCTGNQRLRRTISDKDHKAILNRNLRQYIGIWRELAQK